jgi:hypothetical protein
MQCDRSPLVATLLGACNAVAVAATCSISVAQSSADARTWRTYTNVRFQYTVCYPDDLLVPQSESDNSDGQKFLAADGGQLIVYGHYNALDESLGDALAAVGSRLAGESGKVTYKVLKKNWFVVSGQNGATVFYAKALRSHDQFKAFELTYGSSAAAIYEPVIRHLALCFEDLAR